MVKLLGDSDGTLGAAHGAAEGKWDSIVDLEVNHELAGGDILLQLALKGRRDCLAPCPAAVVGTVRISCCAAVIEVDRPSYVTKSVHGA